jgi:hypothetical protein
MAEGKAMAAPKPKTLALFVVGLNMDPGITPEPAL